LAKIYKEKKEEQITNGNDLTIAEVDYVLKYADALMGLYNGSLTPMMINQRMKDITLNQSQPTETTLTNAINNIKNSENLILMFAQDFEIQSQPYRRLIEYLGDMLAFDWTFVCTNANKESDYKTAKYRKDIEIVKNFFDKFNVKEEFSTIAKQLIRNEAYFGCPRFEGSKYVLQELPSSIDYTLITGRWNYGLMFSFNFQWFTSGGVDINMYPDFFKKKYIEIISSNKKKRTEDYNPAVNPLDRGSSSWAYWQDMPVDVGWCFKMNPSIATRVPYFTGLFLDLIQQPLMRSLQKSANMATALKMIIGQVPLLKETSTKGKDQFAITANNLGKFLSVIQSAVGDSVKVGAAPLQEIESIDFRHEEKLYSSYLKTMASTSGMNSNLFYSSEQKLNAIETELSLNTDEMLMMILYPQFESFLNFHVNRLTNFYKFKFIFEGTKFFNNQKKRFDYQVALCDKGVVMPQKIAASVGMSYFDMERHLMQARADQWVDKLTPIVSGFQMSKTSQDEKGRPQKDTSDLTESGAQTRSDGGNIEKTES
jgi:hypothetical protein